MLLWPGCKPVTFHSADLRSPNLANQVAVGVMEITEMAGVTRITRVTRMTRVMR